MQTIHDDFPMPLRTPPRTVFLVDAGSTVTARALRVAVDKAFAVTGVKRFAWAAHHGMSASALTRALDPSREARTHLDRVAAAVGYVPHPSMSGWYRRRNVVDPVAPDLSDDDLDPETQGERDLARAEREDHDASHCTPEDGDDRGDGWLDSPDGQAVLHEARMDTWLDAWEAERDATWARYSALVPFHETKAFEDAEAEEVR